MTAPQPATPGSDSVRAQIAEALLAATTDYGTGKASPEADLFEYYADALLASPAMDRLRAEATAEALAPFEQLFAGDPDTSCRTTWRREPGWSLPGNTVPLTECVEVPLDDLRDAFNRAAAYRTNPSSEETHRG